MSEGDDGRAADTPGNNAVWLELARTRADSWQITADWSSCLTAGFTADLSPADVVDFVARMLSHLRALSGGRFSAAVTPGRNNPLTLKAEPVGNGFAFFVCRSGRAFGRPIKPASSSPAIRSAAKARRHLPTVLACTPTSRATPSFDMPSAHARMMRAFSAERRCGISVRRTNSARSVSDNVIATAEGLGCDITTGYLLTLRNSGAAHWRSTPRGFCIAMFSVRSLAAPSTVSSSSICHRVVSLRYQPMPGTRR
jgi:hypothetical protein